MHYVAIDNWRGYESIIPKEKHIQSKSETFTVEGYNSLFRHFLARMRRKTKCYSKKIKMLTAINNLISIIFVVCLSRIRSVPEFLRRNLERY